MSERGAELWQQSLREAVEEMARRMRALPFLGRPSESVEAAKQAADDRKQEEEAR